MRLGFLTTLSDDVIRTAKQIGFTGLEVHARTWEDEMKQGRPALDSAVKKARAGLDAAGLKVTCVATYNMWIGKDPAEVLRHFEQVFDIAKGLGVNVVSTLAGRDPKKSIPDNIPAFKAIFAPIAKRAEDAGIRIAFENWSGLGGFPWHGTNIAYRPAAWDLMFDAVPSEALGLEFDPSHLHFQHIEYVPLVHRYAKRIYHVHAKDTEIFHDKLALNGIYGEGWWVFRIPGFGSVDWTAFINALYRIGYDGGIAIEHEDPIFCDERFDEGLRLGYQTLSPLLDLTR